MLASLHVQVSRQGTKLLHDQITIKLTHIETAVVTNQGLLLQTEAARCK